MLALTEIIFCHIYKGNDEEVWHHKTGAAHLGIFSCIGTTFPNYLTIASIKEVFSVQYYHSTHLYYICIPRGQGTIEAVLQIPQEQEHF